METKKEEEEKLDLCASIEIVFPYLHNNRKYVYNNRFLLVPQFVIEYFCQRDVSWFEERVFFEVEGIAFLFRHFKKGD